MNLVMNHSKPNTAPSRGALDAERLDQALARLEDEHTLLLDLAHRHRDALTHASVEDLKSITMQTSEVLIRIAKAEQERQRIVRDQTGAVDTLDALLERFNPDDQERIGQRRARLRELIGRVRDEQQAVKTASENLANHMRGLMKQVSASLSHAGTYSRGGAIDVGRNQVMSSLDTVQ